MTAQLLGLAAIARRLGMSRQRAHVLATRADFPPPAHELDTGRVWHRRDVETLDRRTPPLRPFQRPRDRMRLVTGNRVPGLEDRVLRLNQRERGTLDRAAILLARMRELVGPDTEIGAELGKAEHVLLDVGNVDALVLDYRRTGT